MLLYTSVLCLVVLLVSNMWLLKELERLRRQVREHRQLVSVLDDRVFHLTVAVDELRRPTLGLPQEPGRTPE